MFKHFSSVLDEGRAVIVKLQESFLLIFVVIFRPIGRLFEPIRNLLDRQSPLFSIYYSNFNVRAVLDFIHLENWSNYIWDKIFIPMEQNLEFVAARWITNLNKSTSNIVKKFKMIAKVIGIVLRDGSNKFDNVWVI